MPALLIMTLMALGAAAGFIFLALVTAAQNALASRRRRKRIEREGPDAVQAWLEPIPVIVPQRAPRNGTPWHDEDPPTINQ